MTEILKTYPNHDQKWEKGLSSFVSVKRGVEKFQDIFYPINPFTDEIIPEASEEMFEREE